MVFFHKNMQSISKIKTLHQPHSVFAQIYLFTHLIVKPKTDSMSCTVLNFKVNNEILIKYKIFIFDTLNKPA